jgi:hypothetical protein
MPSQEWVTPFHTKCEASHKALFGLGLTALVLCTRPSLVMAVVISRVSELTQVVESAQAPAYCLEVCVYAT